MFASMNGLESLSKAFLHKHEGLSITKAWKCNFPMTFPMKFPMKIALPGFCSLLGTVKMITKCAEADFYT